MKLNSQMQSMYESFYRSLYRIRRVEEEICRVYPSDKIRSPVHLSIGQESVSVGVCQALNPEDVVFGSYRCHAMYLAKGGDLNQMVAELYGKATGCAKGKGGSMHLVDVSHGVMGASAVVGTTIAQAVGYAYVMKLQRKSSLVVVFFGDGAADEGVLYESLNFAALKACLSFSSAKTMRTPSIPTKLFGKRIPTSANGPGPSVCHRRELRTISLKSSTGSTRRRTQSEPVGQDPRSSNVKPIVGKSMSAPTTISTWDIGQEKKPNPG